MYLTLQALTFVQDSRCLELLRCVSAFDAEDGILTARALTDTGVVYHRRRSVEWMIDRYASKPWCMIELRLRGIDREVVAHIQGTPTGPLWPALSRIPRRRRVDQML